MLAAVRRNSFEEAACEMLDSRWAEQVGSRARELAAMMKSGKWNDNKKKEEI
jgi:lysozyme